MSCGKGLLKAQLKIEVRDRKGRLIAVREKESDLILDNFRDVLAALLIPEFSWSDAVGVGTVPYARYASLVDMGGTARDVAVYGGVNIGTNDHQYIAFVALAGYDLIYAGAMGVRIRVGTSTVSPTRGDYRLGAGVGEGIPTQTVGADYISWAVSIVLEEAADVAEAGLSIRCYYGTVGGVFGWSHFLLFRDTFTPISVPAGGTISVTYTLTL